MSVKYLILFICLNIVKLNSNRIELLLINNEKSIYKYDQLNGHDNNLKYHHQSKRSVKLTTFLVCSLCWCNKKSSLLCNKHNTISSIPVFAADNKRVSITEIIIKYQVNFTHLDQASINSYPNLSKLTIRQTNLATIDENAFQNSKLREINLDGNEIKFLSWKLFDKLPVLELNLLGNPLTCDCKSKWIQLRLKIRNSFLERFRDRLTCYDERKNLTSFLFNHTINGCDIPEISIQPKRVIIRENEMLNATCKTHAIPEPKLFWRTSILTSKYTIEKKSIQRSSIAHKAKQDTYLEQKITIKNINRRDYGYLTCLSENLVGRSSDSIFIQVLASPKIEQFKLKKMFFYCIHYRVTGYPLVNRTWYFNGNLLNFDENIQDLEYGFSKSSINFKEGCLEIKKATRSHEGLYELRVTNSLGNDSMQIEAQFLKEIFPESHEIFDWTSTRKISLDVTQERNTSFIATAKKKTWRGSIIFWTILPISAILVFILFTVLLTYLKRKNHNHISYYYSNNNRSNNHNEIDICSIKEIVPLNGPMVENPNYFNEDSDLTNELINYGLTYIPFTKINIMREIGEGAFGKVYLASLGLITSDQNQQQLVAVKTLKKVFNFNKNVNKDVFREVKLLSSLSHSNIISVVGISKAFENSLPSFTATKTTSSSTLSLMLLFEYMDQGDLNNFLRNNSPDNHYANGNLANNNDYTNNNNIIKMQLNWSHLLDISIQICSGMEYLNKQKFIHRDLATRNCLLNSNLIIKIGDFGMSEDIYAVDYYKFGQEEILPIRWMPPESILYRKFSLESDIWSFGIVLWEIFSFGRQPFYQLTNKEVMQFTASGKVIEEPEYGPEKLYEIILGCLKQNPFERRSFTETLDLLRLLLNSFDKT